MGQDWGKLCCTAEFLKKHGLTETAVLIGIKSRNSTCLRRRRIGGADRGKLFGHLLYKKVGRSEGISQHILPHAAEHYQNNVFVHSVKLGVKLVKRRYIHRYPVIFSDRGNYINYAFIVIWKNKHIYQSLFEFGKALESETDKLLGSKRGIKHRNSLLRFCLGIAENQKCIYSLSCSTA